MKLLVSLLLILAAVELRAQQPGDSSRPVVAAIDSARTVSSPLWRRPLRRFEASSVLFSREAYRYYSSPVTFSLLLEETGIVYPLVLSSEGFGREAFLLTGRTSEPLVSTRVNGALPLNDPLSGTSMLNYFSLDAFRSYGLHMGATGGFLAGGDAATSDVVDLSIERFRTPLPYSRVHYTQDLSRDLANFDGVFSVNPGTSSNVAIGIGRRSAGDQVDRANPVFNPRTDLWSARAQYSYESFLGTLRRDSGMTEQQVDSMLASSTATEQSLDVLVWTNYVNAFMGMNGGIVAETDSSDIFDERLARTRYPFVYEHRVRADGLAQVALPLIAQQRTRLSLFGTYVARKIFELDSAAPSYVIPYAAATRFGGSIEQPLAVRFGSFLTRAVLHGEMQFLQKQRKDVPGSELTETRFSAAASDSIAFEGPLGITAYGFFRLTQSNLSTSFAAVTSEVFPSLGLSGSVNIADWVRFTASYNYAKDWAVWSPVPSTTYQLRNLSGFFDTRIAFSRRDSLAIRAGVMDRNEPEGLVYEFPTDSTLTPRYSNQNLHTQSAHLSLDWYLSYFRFSSALSYFPATTRVSSATSFQEADLPLRLRVTGWAGLFYENEVAEGNLRMSLGARVRWLNRLNPTLTYDPFVDMFVHRGAIATLNRQLLRDARIDQPKALLDILFTSEVDRRAQVNMSFLNILGTPYFTTAIYPRSGFAWRVDVTWAFLD